MFPTSRPPDRAGRLRPAQVFWCPFEAHGPGRYDLELHLRWRRSSEVGDVLVPQPRPSVVGSDAFVPEPCVLQDLPTHLYATPTEVTVGRSGELNVLVCPTDPDHPHRWSLQ